MDFVISSGCPKETKIIDYAINILKMTNIDESNITKQVYLKEIFLGVKNNY